MKKWIQVLLIAVIIVSQVGIPDVEASTKKFKDVGTKHWAHDIINEMVEKGVINGHPDGTFKPNDPVKVDEFIKMLIMSFSKKKANGTRDWDPEFLKKLNVFSQYTAVFGSPGFNFQVGSKYWASTFLEQATNMGIIEKHDRWGGDFTKPLKRGALSYVTFNTITMLESREDFNYANLAKPKIKDIYKAKNDDYYVLQIFIKGIMRGYSNDTFGVDKTVTRAESLVVIKRIHDINQRDPYRPDISKLPYAEVPTNGEKKSKIVIFPTWEKKQNYDALLNSKSKSSGVVKQNELKLIFYKDQKTSDEDLRRSQSIDYMFEVSLEDLVMGFGNDALNYEIRVSTRENSLKPHIESVNYFTKALFKEDYVKLTNKLDGYIKGTKEGSFKGDDLIINNKKVIVRPSGHKEHVYITIVDR